MRKIRWLIAVFALALFACSDDTPPASEVGPIDEASREIEPLLSNRPLTGDKLIFRMNGTIPEDCAGITFTWQVPKAEDGAELSYAFLLPDGSEFRTPFFDARRDAGMSASVYFDLSLSGRPLDDFQGQSIFLHIRVSKGSLLLTHAGDHEFGFHTAGKDGVSWFQGFSTCSAGLVKGEVVEGHEAFGHAVHSAGDVDADGLEDILVASFLADSQGPLTGAVSVFSGKDGGSIHRFEGDQAYARLGCALAKAGDLDADGFDEIVIGAPGGRTDRSYEPVPGAVLVYSGRTGKLLYKLEGLNRGEDGIAWADGFGGAVTGLDDVDGDGAPELLVGAPGWNRRSFWEVKGSDGWARGAGYAAVFSGSDGKLLYKVKSAKHASRFGRSTASLGDLDVDGVADFIVSADGRAEVFSGVDGSPMYTLLKLPHAKIKGKNPGVGGADFGWAVACAGDVNADGTNDILVSGYMCYVNLYSGRDGSLLYTLFEPYGTTITGFAETLAGLGDLDRDGYDDFLIGRAESFEDEDWYDAVIYSGKEGAQIRSFGSREFTKVGAIGDLDRDGYPDLLLGLPRTDHVLVLSGAPPYMEMPVKDPTGSLFVGTRGHRVIQYLRPPTIDAQ